MRAKRAEAWAVFDNTKLGPYLVGTRTKAREIYATLERGTRRIVHLTEADPARDRELRELRKFRREVIAAHFAGTDTHLGQLIEDEAARKRKRK